MTRRIWTMLGAALAALAVTSGALAAGPAYTPQAEQALGERGKAMAQSYLGTESSYSAAALTALGRRYQAMGDFYLSLEPSYTPAALKALGARYQAMADYYDEKALADARAEAAAFDWRDAIVGGLFGVGLAAASALLLVRVRRQARHAPMAPA
jgi:hypothetical protein